MEQDNNHLFNQEGCGGPKAESLKRTTKSDSWFFMGNEIPATQASLLLTSSITSTSASSEMSPLPNWSLEEMANIVRQLAEKRMDPPSLPAPSLGVIPGDPPVSHLLDLFLSNNVVPKTVQPPNDSDVSAIINSINSSMAAANIKTSTPYRFTCRKCSVHGKTSSATVHHRSCCPYKNCFCTGCKKIERIRTHDREYKKDLKNRHQG